MKFRGHKFDDRIYENKVKVSRCETSVKTQRVGIAGAKLCGRNSNMRLCCASRSALYDAANQKLPCGRLGRNVTFSALLTSYDLKLSSRAKLCLTFLALP